jgi:hypothetical protein
MATIPKVEQIWIVDARRNERCFVVWADEKLTAFVGAGSAIVFPYCQQRRRFVRTFSVSLRFALQSWNSSGASIRSDPVKPRANRKHDQIGRDDFPTLHASGILVSFFLHTAMTK